MAFNQIFATQKRPKFALFCSVLRTFTNPKFFLDTSSSYDKKKHSTTQNLLCGLNLFVLQVLRLCQLRFDAKLNLIQVILMFCVGIFESLHSVSTFYGRIKKTATDAVSISFHEINIEISFVPQSVRVKE